MSSSKNTIIITSITSLLSLVLTYFICLNISYNWFELNWLSNSFMLTIFGGAFTSSFVVFLCEIHSYKLKKRIAEDRMYNALIYLYSQLAIIEHTLNKILANSQTQISQGMFIQLQQQSKYFLQEIITTDYTKFYKKNEAYNQFCVFREKSNDIDKIISECTYFDIAVITEKMQDIQYQKKTITSKSHFVDDISTILIKKIKDAMQDCENFLIALDNVNKYGWKDKRNKVNNKLLDNAKSPSLEEYIRENK